MLLFCGLLLVWQEVLGGLARALGWPVRRRERLLWSLLVVAFLLPWASGRALFLPVDETVARNLPGAPSVADPDRHGLYNDVVLQLYPWELEVRRAWRAGRLPFWP